MVIRKFILLSGFLAVLIYGYHVFAEALPPKLGTVNTYVSQNAKYVIEIMALGYPDSSPSQCTFKESGKILWTREISHTPSKVAIADNGSMMAMTNWGWYDEGGSDSLSFYNQKGDPLKEISFPNKWVRVLNIAPDGTYCMIGVNATRNAFFSFYDCRTGELQWEKGYGFSETAEVKIQKAGNYILLATYDYETQDMLFFLLDKTGKILWQKQLAKNFLGYEQEYLRFRENGREFQVFDAGRAQYIAESI